MDTNFVKITLNYSEKCIPAESSNQNTKAPYGCFCVLVTGVEFQRFNISTGYSVLYWFVI